MRNSMSVLGAVVLGLLLTGTLDAAPYQELEPREGYVPVYIREGDTPLLEINPKLAEAFNEIDTKNLLEQANDELELENKPDLILMSVDNGDSMLIAQPPADQVMSEDEPMEVIEIIPPSVNQDESDIAEIPQDNNDDKEDDLKAPQPDESEQLKEAKEAIKELVNVLEVEMLEKLSEQSEEKTAPQQPAVEKNQSSPEEEEAKVVEVLPEASPVSNDSNKQPQEPATDVSTVDAFKTKEIDVKSLETEKIDVPEEEPADTVFTDE